MLVFRLHAHSTVTSFTSIVTRSSNTLQDSKEERRVTRASRWGNSQPEPKVRIYCPFAATHARASARAHPRSSYRGHASACVEPTARGRAHAGSIAAFCADRRSRCDVACRQVSSGRVSLIFRCRAAPRERLQPVASAGRRYRPRSLRQSHSARSGRPTARTPAVRRN
jgi:hypothetical protein